MAIKQSVENAAVDYAFAYPLTSNQLDKAQIYHLAEQTGTHITWYEEALFYDTSPDILMCPIVLLMRGKEQRGTPISHRNLDGCGTRRFWHTDDILLHSI